MNPRLLSIYGPIAITSYGLFVALSLMLFMFCTFNHRVRRTLITEDQYFDLLTVGILSGLAGGRLLFLMQHTGSYSRWYQVFFPWVGGFAILGALLGAIAGLSVYAFYNNIAIFPLLDLAALYAPLAQSVARWGCFFAGCCYGRICSPDAWYALIYTHHDSLAPLYTPLYPSQVIMSLFSLTLFLLLYYWFEYSSYKRYNGQIILFFLGGESLLRFVIEYFRGDHGVVSGFSFYQIVSLSLFVSVCAIHLKVRDGE